MGCRQLTVLRETPKSPGTRMRPDTPDSVIPARPAQLQGEVRVPPAPCTPFQPSSCTYAQSRSSSLSLQLHERVAQSAYVAPTTKCKRRAAVVPKCVVNDGFYSNNNG